VRRLISDLCFSNSDERARGAGPGAIEENPHAQSLGTLDGHQPHLPANMVDIIQPIQLRFIVSRIALQAGNSLLEDLAESRTDFEAFLNSELKVHQLHLGAGMPEAQIFF
jgi:hypothetical protein